MQDLNKIVTNEALSEVIVQMLQGTSFGMFAAAIQNYSEGNKKKATIFGVLGLTMILGSIAFKLSQAKKQVSEGEVIIQWE